MSVDTGSPRELLLQIHDLTMRLEEAEETLRAIRHGDVDAVVVRADQQIRVYALEDADHAYRVLFETLNEGALTVAADGTILYANTRVAELLGLPHAQVLGSRFPDVLPEGPDSEVAEANASFAGAAADAARRRRGWLSPAADRRSIRPAS